jgi:excisionase family DNA binding protein
MNAEVMRLFAEYVKHVGDKAAAAALVTADVMLRDRPEPPDRALSVTEAAERLHVAPKTVYELCQKGELAHHRIGRAIRIMPSDIDTYLSQMARPTPPADRLKRLRL